MVHGIPNEEVIEKTEDSLLLKVLIPSESDYFDGHFPHFKLLPAVAQIDLTLHYAKKYFGLKLCTGDIKRFKFSEKLLPDSLVTFSLKFDRAKKRMVFEISDFNGEKQYASGSYSVIEE